MTAPVKPWEKSKLGACDIPSGARSVESDVMNSNPMYSGIGLHSHSPVTSMPASSMPIAPRQPPRSIVPTPPPALSRTNQGYGPNYTGYGGNMYGTGMTGYGGYGASSYGANSYGSFGSNLGYGGYGIGGFGTGAGYGAYGGYGGYGSTYGRYGGQPMNRFHQNPMNNLENRFIQMAEESSRPAFESIESLVQTFGSVSFMMESTFGALYSSFRAILGVAENFGRLRTLFGQVFSTFAVLRFFQWAYRKLLYLMGVRAENPGRGEAIWQQVSGSTIDPVTGEARRSMWPVALFLGLVCSGPYLVWKLLSSLNVPPPASANDAKATARIWLASGKPLYRGIVRYDFQARTELEMSVMANQKLVVAPPDFQTGGRDWLLVLDSQKSQTGFVPTSFVTIVGQVRPSVRQPGAPLPPNGTGFDEPLLQEPTILPQPSTSHITDHHDSSFPPLEQFVQTPSTSSTFQPGDFEPKIETNSEKISVDEKP